MWTGVIAFTDDLNPILGEFHSMPGYFVCVASTGFTLGPLVARQIAGHLVERGSSEILPEFSPDRIIK
jgi:glycine/D-amino acid oxidase-like deaminating enzyme